MIGGFRSQTTPIGVDIGHSGIRLVQLVARRDQWRVGGAARVAGDFDEIAAAPVAERARRIRSALGVGGLVGRRCVVALPCDLVRMQTVRLPAMGDADLAQAVAWEVCERFGLDRDEIETDFIRTGAGPRQKDDPREEVIALAVRRADLEPWTEALMAAGLRPEAIEPCFCGLARIAARRRRRLADRAYVQVVVDVSETSGTVMILRGNEIALVKPVTVSGRALDEAVTRRLEVDAETAREIRASRVRDDAEAPEGGAADPSVDRAVFDAVRPVLAELAREIVLCLRYYGVTFRGQPPQTLLLTGSEGREPQLDEVLAEATKLPVTYDDEHGTLAELHRGITERVVRTDARNPGAWAVAMGLAARTLLAPKRRRRRDGEEGAAAAAAAGSPYLAGEGRAAA